jgi:NADH dehydrogenase
MHTVIVGGGFGGVKAALELAKNKKQQITLISDKPDFQYYPALYSAATGHSHLESWVPLSTIFAQVPTVTIVHDTVISIDPTSRHISGVSGTTYDYDECIMALGTVTTYFGIKGLDTYAYGIKSTEEIARLKQHLYDDIAEHHMVDKHYVIVGAGPTGVELAAALGTYLQRLCRRYQVVEHNLSIDLIEAAPRVLPRMSESASRIVFRRLQRLGVNVQTGKTVESASATDLVVSGSSIATKTVIWTSGVANHPFYKKNESVFSFAPNGRVVVDEYMRVSEHLYVIGDNAATPFTGLAQTALHDGLFVARNLLRQATQKKLRKYSAVRPPVVVPVGERWAIFEWHGIRFGGLLGAVIRRTADFIGYSDILPLGQALGVWRAARVIENDDIISPAHSK